MICAAIRAEYWSICRFRNANCSRCAANRKR